MTTVEIVQQYLSEIDYYYWGYMIMLIAGMYIYLFGAIVAIFVFAYSEKRIFDFAFMLGAIVFAPLYLSLMLLGLISAVYKMKQERR